MSSKCAPAFDNWEKAEEKLRSEIYETLVELSFANTEEKPAIVGRLTQACRTLNDAILHGKTLEI